MKNIFIGIDFSKETFDATILWQGRLTEEGEHAKFENSKRGCKELTRWAMRQTKAGDPSVLLFCGENTGMYSEVVSEQLSNEGYDLWLESPLRIKHSRGIMRQKDDRTDSRDLARYAAAHREFAVRYKAPSERMKAIRKLDTIRREYVQVKSDIQRTSKELGRICDNSIVREEITFQQGLIKRLDERIRAVEKKMLKLISEDPELDKTYRILTSMKGVSLVNAVALIIRTDNFRQFDFYARRLASYYGVAPFAHTSGTSVKGSPHVSHYADKYLKSILSQAALSAIRFCPSIREYAHRLALRGKHRNVIYNNVKNKMLHILVAMVRDGQPFTPQPINFASDTKKSDIFLCS